MREARRQKDVPDAPCAARRNLGLLSHHSTMDRFDDGGREYGIVGCAVGAPYAVLVAEQLFASGCRLLLSVTSSGQVTTLGPPPYFILIERALRDEGTSYHYLPAGSEYAETDPAPLSVVEGVLATIGDVCNTSAGSGASDVGLAGLRILKRRVSSLKRLAQATLRS